MSAIIAVRAQPVTPHNRALYEAGKQMLVASVDVGREFCKFMVGVSTGAIPLYLALLQLALPKDFRPSWERGIVEIAPAVVFLLAAGAFAVGVFPRTGTFSLDVPAQIDAARTKAINWRRLWAITGSALFGAAALVGIVVTVASLRVKTPLQPTKPIEVRLLTPHIRLVLPQRGDEARRAVHERGDEHAGN